MEASKIMDGKIDSILSYHQATKHYPGRFAPGPGYLDWSTIPDPFRHYTGAPLIGLEFPDDTDNIGPSYSQALSGVPQSRKLDKSSLSSFLYYSMALSAWKEAGGARWALRVNPSSGNLHPTEAYVLAGAIDGISGLPFVAHYSPDRHALELRAQVPVVIWDRLIELRPDETFLLGLSSIYWRESWKYGGRAYRYSELDIGHAIASLAMSAAGLGWNAAVQDNLGRSDLGSLMGLFCQEGPECEIPACMLSVSIGTSGKSRPIADNGAAAAFRDLSWMGEANTLSIEHRKWPVIDDVVRALDTKTAGEEYDCGSEFQLQEGPDLLSTGIHVLARRRRSAQRMDGTTYCTRDEFMDMMAATLPILRRSPLSAFSQGPHAHLLVFVHRVKGLVPGIYLLVRNRNRSAAIRSSIGLDTSINSEPGARGLEMYRILAGDMRDLSQRLFCGQEIASGGCFSLAMLCEFMGPLRSRGPEFYPRLFWECGAIGQILYLQAELHGLKGCGIGCYFDDAVHRIIGLEDLEYQCMYAFTVGGALDDPRIATMPAYTR